MKKKFGWMLLCAMLALCLTVTNALAVDATLNKRPDDDSEYRSVVVNSATLVGDTLYILQNNRGSFCVNLMKWQLGAAEMETVAQNLAQSNYVDTMDELQTTVDEWESGVKADVEHAVSYLFSDGERLMSLNMITGKLFAIKEADGKLVYEDIATIKNLEAFRHVSDDYSYAITPEGRVVVGGKLLWLLQDWDDMTGMSKNRLLVIDLATGELKESQIKDVQSVSAYKDGKAIIAVRSEEDVYDSKTDTYKPASLQAYDPAADTAQEIGQMQATYRVFDSVYCEALDALVWVNNNRVMGLKGLKEEKQFGYMPGDANELLACGDSLIMPSGNAVYVRTISEDFRTDESVTVYGGYMDSGARLFAERNPQIPVYMTDDYYNTTEKLTQAMVTGESIMDVLRMNVATGSFTTLRDKGYCADLSESQIITDYVNKLYPHFAEAVKKDGKVIAVPLSAYSYDGWFVNKRVLEGMGLTMEDVPTNLVDLCAFANRWNDEWVDEYPSYTLIEYVSDYKRAMLSEVLESYIRYCTAKKQEIDFTSDMFRQMMEALDKMNVKELDRGANTANEDETTYREALLMRDNSLVGSFEDYSDTEDAWRLFLPMTLTADADFVTGAEMEIVFVNPKSEHKAAAMQLIECMIEKMNDYSAYTLRADKTEPILNENYDDMVAEQEKYLAQLKADYEKADDADKKEYQSMIESQEKWMGTMDKYRYRISPEGIDWYVKNVVPATYVMEPSILDRSDSEASGAFETLRERYAAGQMKLDQFIREMNSKIQMMQMEDY